MHLEINFPSVGGAEKIRTKAETASAPHEGDVSFGDVVWQSHENTTPDGQAFMLPVLAPEVPQAELPPPGEAFGFASVDMGQDVQVTTDVDAPERLLSVTGNAVQVVERGISGATIAEATIKGQLSGQSAAIRAHASDEVPVATTTIVNADVLPKVPQEIGEKKNMEAPKMRSEIPDETRGVSRHPLSFAPAQVEEQKTVSAEPSKAPLTPAGSAGGFESPLLTMKGLVSSPQPDEEELVAEGQKSLPRLTTEKPIPENLVVAPKPLTSGSGVQGAQTASFGDARREVEPSSRSLPEGEGPKPTTMERDHGTSVIAANHLGSASIASLQTGQDRVSPPNQASELSTEMGAISEFAVNDVRTAETLTARAEISAHLRAELPRHIAVQLADVARLQPDRPVELTLSPEELGRLRLTFSGDMSAMTVSVNVERPETLDLMRRHVDLLAQEMRDIGYGEVSFSFEQSGAETGGRSGNIPTGSPFSACDEAEEDTIASLAASPLQLNLSDHTGVDIRL